MSDVGGLVEAQLVLDKDGRLAGLVSVRRSRLIGEEGRALTGKVNADAEGPALLPNGGRLVSFEGLAFVPRPDGRLRFYLVPDDTVSPRERTLLLAFDWNPGGGS